MPLEDVEWVGDDDSSGMESIEPIDHHAEEKVVVKKGEMRPVDPAPSMSHESVGTTETIPFDKFAACDIRVAEVIGVEDVPAARKPMWKLRLDVGELGTRYIVAGIKPWYTKEELLGRLIVIVANLEPRKIAGEMSQGMLLAAEEGEENVVLLSLDRKIRPGAKIH